MTNKLLWSSKSSNTLIDDFIKKISNYTSTNNYHKIHEWSIQHKDQFWNAIWDFTKIIGNKKDGEDIGDHLKEEDPYLYVHNKNENLSFNGVRVYKIGDIMAYRIQKEEKTHPYGKAYLLDVENMFNEFLEDMEEKEEAINGLLWFYPKEKQEKLEDYGKVRVLKSQDLKE